MTTRCEDKVKELLKGCNNMLYNSIDVTVNTNGRGIIQVCKDNNRLDVNNLHTVLHSSLVP